MWATVSLLLSSSSPLFPNCCFQTTSQTVCAVIRFILFVAYFLNILVYVRLKRLPFSSFLSPRSVVKALMILPHSPGTNDDTKRLHNRHCLCRQWKETSNYFNQNQLFGYKLLLHMLAERKKKTNSNTIRPNKSYFSIHSDTTLYSYILFANISTASLIYFMF